MATTTFQPPPTYASPVVVDEVTGEAQFNPIWLKWFVDVAAFITVSSGGVQHNLTGGLQGGTTNEYYHLTAAQFTLYSGTKSANAVLAGPTSGAAATPTFRALVTADLPAGTGTVTSVAQSVPAEFSVGGSPITGSGTLAITKNTQSANQVWAGPSSGAAAQPTFRTLVEADMPSAGISGTATLAKITGGGANGSLTFTNGLITGYVAPT